MKENPLLVYKNDTDDSYIRFDLIKDEHFEPAFEEALKTAKINLYHIIDNADIPTFQNSVEALEYVDEDLKRITLIFTNLKEAHTTKELERVADSVMPKVADFENDLLLNEKLFEKVKYVYESKPANLTKEQERFLELKYKSFVKRGALLSDSDKQLLRSYDKDLVLLTQKFGKNVLDATNAYELHITEEEKLSGIPERVKEMASLEAKERGKQGWVFTLKAPSSGPFMQYCSDEGLRKELSVASSKRGMEEPFDNKKVIFDVVSLRHKKAHLLGYESHADFVLDDRMAKTPKTVEAFLKEIAETARPFAQKDFENIRSYKEKQTQSHTLNAWDVAYFEEKYKKEYFDFDEESLRPYFEIGNVIEGVFEHARRLYGIRAYKRNDIPVYYSDIVVYELQNEKGLSIGLLYLDLYPRDSKRQGEWIDVLRQDQIKNGAKITPHLLIVCNLTKPTPSVPALISYYETKVLFHEFGHALSSLLSDTQYASMSGFGTLWDFIEFPSQIMESWLTQKESIQFFAKHYQTGEVLPDEQIEKMLSAERFMKGWGVVSQASAALLDLMWHTKESLLVDDIEVFEQKVRGPYRFFPSYPGTSLSTTFRHIFSGGYDVGYYSYHWAEVLAADAFEYFKEKGLFSKEVADKLRYSVFAKGNAVAPEKLYRDFRGRDADPKALFRHKGLL